MMSLCLILVIIILLHYFFSDTASGWSGDASSDLDLSKAPVPFGFVGMYGANKVGD